MYGSTEFQVAAKTVCSILETSFEALNGQDVCQRLGRVLMTAISCINQWDRYIAACHAGSSLFGVTHHNNIGVTFDCPNGIGNAFAFGSRTGTRLGKPDYLTA